MNIAALGYRCVLDSCALHRRIYESLIASNVLFHLITRSSHTPRPRYLGTHLDAIRPFPIRCFVKNEPCWLSDPTRAINITLWVISEYGDCWLVRRKPYHEAQRRITEGSSWWHSIPRRITERVTFVRAELLWHSINFFVFWVQTVRVKIRPDHVEDYMAACTCPVPDFQSLNQAHRLHSFRSGTCGFGVGKVVHSEKSGILSKFCCMRTATKSITVADDWSLLFTYEQWHVMTAQRSWGMSSMHLSHPRFRLVTKRWNDATPSAYRKRKPTRTYVLGIVNGLAIPEDTNKNPGESEFE